MTIPAVLKDIKSQNKGKKIKLRYKETPKNGYSLYLDLWHNGKRQYDFLQLYVSGTPGSRANDREKVRLAGAIRDQKEIDLYQTDVGIEVTNWKKRADFLEYMRTCCKTSESNRKTYVSAANRVAAFYGKDVIPFSKVDETFCAEFKTYLLEEMSRNGARSIFAAFKASLNRAVKERIIKDHPARHETLSGEETERAFLTVEEVKQLDGAPCDYPHVKNAFLFGCFTGLRYSDLENLQWTDIEGEYLAFKQKKTGGVERAKLSKKAMQIIDEQKAAQAEDQPRVFVLEYYERDRLHLIEWLKKSNIKKPVTFHTARHTFATMCLTHDIDIYTVSKLLGHKNLKTTQIYAKLIDKKKDEAIDKLPDW